MSNISAKITLEGATGLRKKLQSLPREMTAGLKGEVDSALKGMRNEARRNIKAGFDMRTRNLWRNITYMMDIDGLGGQVGLFKDDNIPGDAFYGRFLEYGTRKGLKKKPWLYPAFRKHRRLFSRRVYRAIKKILS